MKIIRMIAIVSTTAIAFLVVALLAERIYAQVALPQGITGVQSVTLESYSNGGTVRTTSRLSAVSRQRGIALLERDESAYPNVPGYHYRLLQLADGRRIDVFDPIKTKTTYYMPYGGDAGRAAMNQRQARQCAGGVNQIVGTGVLFGVRVVQVSKSNAEREWTTWAAPDYGCQQLQQAVVWKDGKTGAVTGKSSYRLRLS
jgi:hypothetical protein